MRIAQLSPSNERTLINLSGARASHIKTSITLRRCTKGWNCQKGSQIPLGVNVINYSLAPSICFTAHQLLSKFGWLGDRLNGLKMRPNFLSVTSVMLQCRGLKVFARSWFLTTFCTLKICAKNFPLCWHLGLARFLHSEAPIGPKFQDFGGTQSFLNLVEHGHFLSSKTLPFLVFWWNTVIFKFF